MRSPIFVRPFSEEERQQVEQGVHGHDAFVLRRCQILLASARGERVPRIAEVVGGCEQTVRDVIHGFNQAGLPVLHEGSSRPHRTRQTFTHEQAEEVRALLHRSPREFGRAHSLWSLNAVAEVSLAQGITEQLVSDETIRRTLRRLQINWKRAKHWITSSDPAYARKKTDVTA